MPKSAAELKRLLGDKNEIELTVVGRKSGRKSSRAVWFVLEGDSLIPIGTRTSSKTRRSEFRWAVSRGSSKPVR